MSYLGDRRNREALKGLIGLIAVVVLLVVLAGRERDRREAAERWVAEHPDYEIVWGAPEDGWWIEKIDDGTVLTEALAEELERAER